MSDERFPCPHCGKTRFRDGEARYQHVLAVHPGKPTKGILPLRVREERDRNSALQKERRRRYSDDDSLADIAISAQWKHAAGLPLDLWEESMLP